MKYVANLSNDPRNNLAFEEYCFKNLPKDEDYESLMPSVTTEALQKYFATIEKAQFRDLLFELAEQPVDPTLEASEILSFDLYSLTISRNIHSSSPVVRSASRRPTFSFAVRT